MFRFASLLVVGFTSGVDILDDFDASTDTLSLLQLRASMSKQEGARSTCNGIVPENGIVMECEFPWPVWFNGNQMSEQCIGEESGYHGIRFAGGGSWCLSKEPLPTGISKDSDGTQGKQFGPGGRSMIQCTPGCPGYVEPFQSVSSEWNCPDGVCTCRAWGDPHIWHTFRNHHIDWQGYGIYNYAETKTGDLFHAAQCKQPFYGRNMREQTAKPGNGEAIEAFTEIFASAYRIRGHDVVLMRNNWAFTSDPFFRQPLQTFPPGKGAKYAIRVDQNCYQWWGPRLGGMDCITGARKPEGDVEFDNIAGGDLKIVTGANAGLTTMRGSDNVDQGNSKFIVSRDGAIKVFVSGSAWMTMEAPQAELRNAGACANKHTPGFPDNAEDSPWDGSPVPLDEMIFNELELDYICNWWCGLPEDTANGFKLCDPPVAPVPKEPTPEQVCEKEGVGFSDAQTRCSKFDAVLLHDCLYDYCASDGDERFLELDEQEQELQETDPQLQTIPGPLVPPVVECGHTEEKLDFSHLVSSNLGGTGPQDGEQVMRFSNVRKGVDMTITCTPYSNAARSSKNAAKNGIAAINMPPKSSSDCTFQFVLTGTQNAMVVENVGISFLDLDQGKKPKKGFEAVTICDADVVGSGDNSELTQSKDGQGCDRFQSSSFGTGKDNPRSVTDLTALQKSRTASAYWASVSSFTVTLENNMRTARPIMFTGAPLECL